MGARVAPEGAEPYLPGSLCIGGMQVCPCFQKEIQMSKKQKRMLMVVLVLLLFMVASTLSVIAFSSFNKNSQNIVITDLRVCTKNIVGSSESINRYCEEDLSSSTNQIFVCGNIVSSVRVMPPTIYLFKNGQDNPVYYASLDKIGNGSFCQAVPLPDNNHNGIYSIKIYNYRKIIVTTDFQFH